MQQVWLVDPEIPRRAVLQKKIASGYAVIQDYPLFRSSILSYITHMPLFAGTKLEPNHILAPIGAGDIGGTRPETRDVALRVREIL